MKVFEAYAEAVAATSWHFSAGFRRTPLFHTAKDEYLEGLPVPELSPPVRAMWPGVDLGAEVHYTPDTLPVEAWLRVGNGSQSVGGNNDEHLAYDARADYVMGRARGHDLNGFGLRVGAGGHAKYQENATGLTDTTPDGFVFYHPAATFGWRTLGEAHAAAWWGPLSATLEGGIAREERSLSAVGSFSGARIGKAPVTTRGAALEVAWMVWGARRIPGQWPGEQQFALDSWHGGSVDVAARLERVDLDADAPDIKPGGGQGGSIAVNWWATRFAALSLAAYDTQYFLNPIEEPTESSSVLVMARATVSFR